MNRSDVDGVRECRPDRIEKVVSKVHSETRVLLQFDQTREIGIRIPRHPDVDLTLGHELLERLVKQRSEESVKAIEKSWQDPLTFHAVNLSCYDGVIEKSHRRRQERTKDKLGNIFGY